MLGSGFVKILLKRFNDNFNLKPSLSKICLFFYIFTFFETYWSKVIVDKKNRTMKKRFVYIYIHKLLAP